MTRLVLKLPLSQEQAKASTYLMNMEGVCTCGRLLHPSDAKFLLADVGTYDSPIPERRNAMALVAYCFDCASKINETLRRCKDACYRQKRSESELRG